MAQLDQNIARLSAQAPAGGKGDAFSMIPRPTPDFGGATGASGASSSPFSSMLGNALGDNGLSTKPGATGGVVGNTFSGFSFPSATKPGTTSSEPTFGHAKAGATGGVLGSKSAETAEAPRHHFGSTESTESPWKPTSHLSAHRTSGHTSGHTTTRPGTSGLKPALTSSRPPGQEPVSHDSAMSALDRAIAGIRKDQEATPPGMTGSTGSSLDDLLANSFGKGVDALDSKGGGSAPGGVVGDRSFLNARGGAGAPGGVVGDRSAGGFLNVRRGGSARGGVVGD